MKVQTPITIKGPTNPLRSSYNDPLVRAKYLKLYILSYPMRHDAAQMKIFPKNTKRFPKVAIIANLAGFLAIIQKAS
jgi:hypothetical protein